MKDFELTAKARQFNEKFDHLRETKIQTKLEEFERNYRISKIENLELEDYVYGRYPLDHNKTFCYFMEKELDDFGKISGSPCSQYGLWFGTHGEDKEVRYRHTKRYGANLEVAFRKIKQSIQDLYDYGNNDNYLEIAKSMIGNKYKGKLLTTYFPDKYLSIYADDYLNDILKYFNLDDHTSFSEAPIYKQQRLLNLKARVDIMKDWNLIKFAMFINEEIYENFYAKEKSLEDLVPSFPNIIDVRAVELTDIIDEAAIFENRKAKQHEKPLVDYGKRSVLNKATGDRGEQIVFLSEVKKVAGYSACKGKKVDWVSRRTDGYGFDIISYDDKGNEIQIEVKSTASPLGRAEFFLSNFEYEIAETLKNYQLYCVFDVNSVKPYIWKMIKPFHPNKIGVNLKPIAYKVEIARKPTI